MRNVIDHYPVIIRLPISKICQDHQLCILQKYFLFQQYLPLQRVRIPHFLNDF